MITATTKAVNRDKPGQLLETPPYELYTSLEELLAPETLSELTGAPVSYVRCSALDREGYSGSRLLAVEATHGSTSRSYVLKQTSPQRDWIMQISADHHCRSVTLWQYGLLDRLQPEVEHAIIACARDQDGWAILMHDVTQRLIRQPRTNFRSQLDSATIRLLLDGLATIHARFWQAPGLAAPALGLCDSAGILTMLTPQTMQRIVDPSWPPWQWITEGWPLLQDMVAPDVADILADLIADPSPLVAALARYPATLLHGDYACQNLGLTGQKQRTVIALDWQMAGHSAATIDLAWFLHKSDVTSSPVSIEAALTYYRQRLADRLGNRFNEAWWQPMWALGRLVNVLRLGSIYAWLSVHASSGAIQATRREAIEKYEKWVRTAVKWL